MKEPYHSLFAKLRQLVSASSIAYLQKWLPAALLIGVVAGLASIVFYEAISWATEVFLGLGAGFVPPLPAGEGEMVVADIGRRWMIPVITTLGGLVSGLIVFKFAPEAEGHGTDAAIDAFHRRDGVVRPRIPLVKMLASAITIGSGGSAGREGPTAQIAAGCGSLVGKLFRFNAYDRRLAVAVGIGAGIGSIFEAPLGGAILSTEILYLQGFEIEALIPSFISTIMGYCIFASWRGFTPVFGEYLVGAFHEPKALVSYAILGIACGLVGLLYTRTFYGVRDLFGRLKVNAYLKPAIGGLATGLIGLFLPQVLGTGYGWVQLVMEPDTTPLAIMGALIFAKLVATSFSIGSGGSGGVFAPGLVIGGMVAACLWAVGALFMGDFLPASSHGFVIVGMMALFGAVAHAPIATIIMVSEMTGSYVMLPPAMVAVGLANVVVGRNTIYQSQVATPAASPAHRYEYVTPLLRTMKVSQAMITSFECLSNTAHIEEAAILIQSHKMPVPVTDREGRLVGIIAKQDVLPIPLELGRVAKVEDVMATDLAVTKPGESLEQALELMVARGVASLPVVSEGDPTKLEGLVTRRSIIQTYESEARKMLRGRGSS